MNNTAQDEELGADPLPEAALLSVVRNRLEREGIDGEHLLILRQEREIHLEGSVPSSEERELAEIVARGTPGVSEVHCSLRVD